MKKIFILTGEPSGDKLASKVIGQLKSLKSDIEYLSVGGEHLRALGIKSLYELKEVTYGKFGEKDHINEKIDELNQETESLIDEIEKWQT